MTRERPRVRVLSSYIYEDDAGPYSTMGRRNRWFHGFVHTLIEGGASLSDFELEFVPLPRAATGVEATYRRWREQGVQLVICAGTDSAVRWLQMCDDIPTLYFGAHPENNGLELVTRPNVGGVRLNLPLVWSYDNFAILGALMPGLRAVYIPVNVESEFAFPNVRAAYSEFRRESTAPWIPGTSGWCGHRSIQFLADRLGCDYYEGPYASVEQLLDGLAAAGSENCAFVGFNDTLLMDHAANSLLAWCTQNDRALFWVNNWPIIASGGVADFSSRFEAVGKILGRQALAILRDGRSMDAIGFAEDPGELFSLNLARCVELALDVPEALRTRFHVVEE